MANRFRYSKAGFDAVRNDPEVMAACLAHAQATAAAANAQTKGNFVADVRPGPKRCTAAVKPDQGVAGAIAARDVRLRNILIKSVR